jgi:type IV pilus assembly protein PilA
MLQKLKKRIKNQRGMTLVELLAVIVILGIISAIAIPSIGKVIENSKRDAIRADALQILNAAKLYAAENGVPETAIEPDDLENYIENLTTFDGNANEAASASNPTYTVNFNGNSSPEITGVGAKGGVSITFNSADISEIDKAKKGATTVGE